VEVVWIIGVLVCLPSVGVLLFRLLVLLATIAVCSLLYLGVWTTAGLWLVFRPRRGREFWREAWGLADAKVLDRGTGLPGGG